MKKIDLHIHTVPTISDGTFEFSMEKLKEYVTQMKLDAIAITNHNFFDNTQFQSIQENLPIPVFPGVEVNLCRGHILVFTSKDDINDFDSKVQTLSQFIKTKNDFIDLEKFKDIFPNYTKYLLIPHFDKDPKLPLDIIRHFGDSIYTGEVRSPKKFMYLLKNRDLAYTPVLFSDLRAKSDIKDFPSRQTFVSIGDITLSALKTALKDKSKVSLDSTGNQNLIDIYNGEVKFSQGLNIILGRRSSGKTHTLNLIQSNFGKDKVKYIHQFELLQKDSDKEAKSFDSKLSERRSSLQEEFLEPFKDALDQILQLPTEEDDASKIDKYLSSLKGYAYDQRLQDVYSSCRLFNEQKFSFEQTNLIEKLIKSVINLLDSYDGIYKDVLSRYIEKNSLIALFIDLHNEYVQLKIKNRKKLVLNDLIDDIKEKLKLKSSREQVVDVDIKDIVRHRIKRQKFIDVCKYLQHARIIKTRDIRHFRVEAKAIPYSNASDMKKCYPHIISFYQAFLDINNPIKFIYDLKEQNVPNGEMYKLFVKIVYKVYNQDGFELSGGEQSEFNLLNSISDAANYDMLLLDEPESSFDNIFLKDDVNQMLKDFANEMPVVVVTHNSTIGASINPDYLIYTKKEYTDGQKVFKVYYGSPTDKFLKNKEGESIPNFNVQMDSLEAGEDAYKNRKEGYENLKN